MVQLGMGNIKRAMGPSKVLRLYGTLVEEEREGSADEGVCERVFRTGFGEGILMEWQVAQPISLPARNNTATPGVGGGLELTALPPVWVVDQWTVFLGGWLGDGPMFGPLSLDVKISPSNTLGELDGPRMHTYLSHKLKARDSSGHWLEKLAPSAPETGPVSCWWYN